MSSSSSVQRLTMESEGKNSRGVFVRRRVLICTGVFVATLVVVVALLVHYLTPCVCKSDESSDKTSPTVPAGPESAVTDVRLPSNLRPLNYQLRIQPFLDNFTFNGRVVILVQCVGDTGVITLHANKLTVKNDSIDLIDENGQKKTVTSYEFDPKRQFLHFYVDGPLIAGRNYTLSLDYGGELNENLVGFYRSRYDDTKWMATTQFQATDARRAFPCFDEPGFKATFTVSLVRLKDLMSISNMPRKDTQPLASDSNWMIDNYQTTPKMSTYLLAFIVTNFSSNYKKSDSGVDFRVYSRHDAINQTEFATETGPRALEFYNDFFKIDYPLPKQDMVAVPDFEAGAMENWGLITYRETALLYDPKISSVVSKERVAVVIAHELAHQWFGNLVTPVWWDDLWLNEGFASYMENVAVDFLFKEWKVLDQFAATLHAVLEADSLKSSHPVSVPVRNPDEISEIFDFISYGKGAAIIRMMTHFLSVPVFQQGLKSYFEEKQYSSAVQDDLWRHMTEAAKSNNLKLDIKKIMDTWTVQIGYPVINVTRINDDKVTLTQKRFLLIPETKDVGSQERWEIPISFTTQAKREFDNTSPIKWMHNSDSSIDFTRADGIPPSSEWFIFNVQQTGYYRVNYDNDNWKKITQQMNDNHTDIHVLNRAQLIDDSLNLARAGELDYGTALNIVKYMVKERDYVPWLTGRGVLAYIDAMLSRTAAYGMWQEFRLKLVQPAYISVGFINAEDSTNPADHLTLLSRRLFVEQACKFGLKDCIDRSTSYYSDWMTNGETIFPNLKDYVLCTAIKKGGEKEWNFAWEKYLESNVASEKITLLKALACTQEPWLLSRYLNDAIDPKGKIRSQDAVIVIAGIAENKIGRFLTLDFVRDKWRELKTIFNAGFILSKIFKVTMADLNTRYELKQLHEFMSANKGYLGGIDRSIKQVIEETESNIKWMEQNYETIKTWLEQQKKPD